MSGWTRDPWLLDGVPPSMPRLLRCSRGTGASGALTMPRPRSVRRDALLRLRLVTSRGPPYPSRSPRAHPSGWTRTQLLSRRDSHAPRCLLVSYTASLAARHDFEPFARRYGCPLLPITGYSPAFSLAELLSNALEVYVPPVAFAGEALGQRSGRRGAWDR